MRNVTKVKMLTAKTVKVKAGKKYVKKYKKIFTKKNCGNKVRVNSSHE